MSWNWAVLMPHPPILIPEIGQGREQEAAQTGHGLKLLLQKIKDSNQEQGAPDYLFVLSPHQPYAPGALCINRAVHMEGNFSPFGVPEVALSLSSSYEAVSRLSEFLLDHGIPVEISHMHNITQDHGSLVPLYFLSQCFPEQTLPPVIIASPIGLSPRNAFTLGKVLSSFKDGTRWGFVASGDLSHKLMPGAPAGYHPDGALFDQAIVEALSDGDPAPLAHLSASILHNAGECGLRSVMALLGLVQSPLEVCSYEGPFGVGYCNAVWVRKNVVQAQKNQRVIAKETQQKTYDSLPSLARMTVTHYLNSDADSPWRIPDTILSSPAWHEKKACFVSIKLLSGELRGCIGTLLPLYESLGHEVMQNAIAAATRDYRFTPMQKNELDNVRFSVDVLSTPEPVYSLNELDPSQFGVILTKGNLRGVLLPDLEGITTVDHQLAIAAQKAGMETWHDATIQRFTVERFQEK